MTDVEKFIDKIIPYPADYSHRNGFGNEHYIDQLNSLERIQVEDALINKLAEHPEDLLIVETLAYMNSRKALDVLYKLLYTSEKAYRKIIIASCIFIISNDTKMCDIAFEACKTITDKYSLTSMFYHLAKMKDERINDFIRQYEKHSDLLLSYNAERSLRLYGK